MDGVVGLELRCSSSRILRVYCWKRAHSVAVGSLLKDFQVQSLRKGKSMYLRAHDASILIPNIFRKALE